MKKRFICALLVCVLLLSIAPMGPMKVKAVSNMTVSEAGLNMIKVFEGFISQAYWDNKQWSIGYGTAIDDDLAEYYAWGGPNHLSVQEADQMLRQAIASKETYVNAFIDTYGLHDYIDQSKFDALVSLSFNVGPNWSMQTNSDAIMHQTIKNKREGSALVYAFVLYSKSGGYTSVGHINRRRLEAQLYLTGVYSNDVGSLIEFGYVFLDGNGGTTQYTPHGFYRRNHCSITATFTAVPQGVDEYGNTFNYEFAGWFTQPVGGTEVKELVGTTPNASILYAQWKNPQGEIVPIPNGTPVTVINPSVNFMTGPGNTFSVLGTAYQGTQLNATLTIRGTDGLWRATANGWLMAGTVSESTQNPDSGSGSDPEGTTQITPTFGTVNGSNVNIRIGPGTNYSLTGIKKQNGDRVVIVATAPDAQGVDRLWGKMDDGNWICMDYVVLDPVTEPEEPGEPEIPAPTVTGITMLSGPDKTEYLQKTETLLLNGAQILVTYSDDTTQTVNVTMGLISGFSNETPGTCTIIVTYEGMTTAFDVHIIKPTITFLNEDGSLLGTAQIAYGEAIVAPEEVLAQLGKAADRFGPYIFSGWDTELGTCSGNATFTAVYELEFAYGDVDCDGDIDEDDAIYLLRNVVFAEKYPVVCQPDFDKDGDVDEDDAIYLLRHVIFAEKYPLE